VSEQRTYDEKSQQVKQRYLGLDKKPVITSMGYAGWDAEYDERGNVIRKVYLDTTGTPLTGRPAETFAYDTCGNYIAKYLNAAGHYVLNADGVAERHVERDPFGNDKKNTYRGLDGKPAKRRDGFAGWEGDYDRFQNRVEQRQLDENGKLTPGQDGTARTTWTYDSRQRRTGVAYWNAEDKPLVLTPQNYAGWRAEYDDRGRETKRTYFGADGNPIDIQYGFASFTAEYLNESGVVRHEWFSANGTSISNQLTAYDSHGGRTETAPSSTGGTVIRKFDRAGRQILCAYLKVDGEPDVYRELDLAFSRFEEDFDRCGRSTEKRYYDANTELFRSIHKTYDPAGKELESVQTDAEPFGRRITRTYFLPEGQRIEVSFTDVEGNACADEFGRGKSIEHLDAQGRRVRVEYFDLAGQPKLFHGHYWSENRYDELGYLREAIYSFPVDEDSTLNKRLKFGPKGSPRVAFQSVSPDGKTEQNEGYLLEYRMLPGDEAYYVTRVNVRNNECCSTLDMQMRQVCCGISPDESYLISVEVVALDANGQPLPPTSMEMRMARTGRMLETSSQTYSSLPMPAYPVFPGDRWFMHNPMELKNPFTQLDQVVVLNYWYTLRRIFTTEEGLRLAEISVDCPETRVPLEPAGAWIISGAGTTFFEVEKGLLLASHVMSRTVISTGREEVATEVNLQIQYSNPHPQSSAGISNRSA